MGAPAPHQLLLYYPRVGSKHPGRVFSSSPALQQICALLIDLHQSKILSLPRYAVISYQVLRTESTRVEETHTN